MTDWLNIAAIGAVVATGIASFVALANGVQLPSVMAVSGPIVGGCLTFLQRRSVP